MSNYLGIIGGRAARLTRKYPSTGHLIEPFHHRLVLLALDRQRLGRGSISTQVRAPTFLKTARHLAPFGIGMRTQGQVMRILLVDLIQVLLVMALTIMHIVDDWDYRMRSRIRVCGQFTPNQ